MSQNKTSKYLKYAIGEIVLVVIGILIALQVSNWNEVRKTKESVRKTLTSLKNEIEINEKQVSNVFPYHKMLRDTLRNIDVDNLLSEKEKISNFGKDIKSLGRTKPHFKQQYGLVRSKILI